MAKTKVTPPLRFNRILTILNPAISLRLRGNERKAGITALIPGIHYRIVKVDGVDLTESMKLRNDCCFKGLLFLPTFEYAAAAFHTDHSTGIIFLSTESNNDCQVH